MSHPIFCHACGGKLRLRFPGGDSENGAARPTCTDQNCDAINLLDRDTRNRKEAEGQMFEQVLEVLEMHLDTVPEPDLESMTAGERALMGAVAVGPEYRALRSLRKDLIERLMKVTEEQWDEPDWRVAESEGHNS